MDNKKILFYARLRPEEVSVKIQQEIKQFHSLSVFFQSIRKDVERFASSIQKASITLKVALSSPNDWSEVTKKLLTQYETFALNLNKLSLNLKSIIQPLDEFIVKYETYNKQLLHEANKTIEEIMNQKKKIMSAKKKYFKEDKVIASAKTEDGYKNKVLIADNLKKEYKELVISFNKTISNKESKYTNLFKAWNKNEDMKMCYIKEIFESFHKLLYSCNPIWQQLYSSSVNTIKLIPSIINIQPYIDRTNKNDLFLKVLFELPENANKSLRENESVLDQFFPCGVKDAELDFIGNKIKELLNDQFISEIDTKKLFSLAKTVDGFYITCDQLINVNTRIELENIENFNKLIKLAMIMLDELATQKFQDSGCLSSILTLGSSILFIKPTDELNKYLREGLVNHSIWRIKDTWYKILDYKISKSLDYLNAYIKQHSTKANSSDKQVGKKNIYFNEISFIVSEMAMYFIDKDQCRELAIEYCNRCDLEFNKVYQILSDCEAAQVIPREEKAGCKDIFRYSLQKRERERKKYGYSKATMIVGLSMKYILDLRALTNVLLVNKDWNSIFKAKVQRLALKYHSDTIRFLLWRSMLHSQGMESLYLKLREHSKKSLAEANKGLEDIIKLDVIRSFSSYSETERSSIMNILRSYSLLNSEVEYCQGMNYIAGFLYLIYKNEAIAFDMLCGLIANFKLSDLFKPGIPLLRVYFYQLNRLIAIFLPKLHSHLYKEGINATFFSSSWFLTVFTYVLQATKDAKPPLLLLIFDEFLYKGINALFKTALFILEYFEEKLLKSNSDRVVKILNEIQKSDFFYSQEVMLKYKEYIAYYNITEELLNRLNDEYVEIYTISEKKKIIPCEPRAPFKYYIRSRNFSETPLVSVYLAN